MSNDHEEVTVQKVTLTLVTGRKGPIDKFGKPFAPRSQSVIRDGFQSTVSYTVEAFVSALLQGCDRIIVIDKDNNATGIDVEYPSITVEVPEEESVPLGEPADGSLL